MQFMDGEHFYGAAYSGAGEHSHQEESVDQGGDFDGSAEHQMESGIDLNKRLINNRASTFLFKMNGDAMQGAGIFSGDTLVVDRSVRAVSGRVVIAVLNGELLVRRLEKIFNKIRLLPETSKLAPIDIDPSGAEFSIWGVVVYSIHAV